LYDETYYENGLEAGVSCYEKYRWLPELTIPMCAEIIELLEIDREQTILDFGCAKGFMVKAFRMLHRQAWGYDISEYAHLTGCVSEYMVPNLNNHYDWVIAKDVFEHITPPELDIIIDCLNCNQIFAVVPLAANGKYMNPSDEKDVTHIIRENLGWWDTFMLQHFRIVESRLSFGHLKNESPPNSQGFITGRDKR